MEDRRPQDAVARGAPSGATGPRWGRIGLAVLLLVLLLAGAVYGYTVVRERLESARQIDEATALLKSADATVMAAGVQAFLHDVVDRQAELGKLAKRRQTLARGIKAADGKLSNARFIENAPPEVVEREKQRLAAMRQELEAVEKALSQLQ